MMHVAKQDQPPNVKCLYWALSLPQLLALVVEKADQEALEEFHEHRTIFRYNGSPPLRCAEYVDRLRKTALNRGEGTVADQAYSLTIDKFSNLPSPSSDSSVPPSPKVGPDCRHYFRVFVEAANRKIQTLAALGEIQREFAAAALLQGLVARHFRLSILECRRATGLMSRYVWATHGGHITVAMPRGMSGRKRREWLEANVTTPDPDSRGERQRIQAIIDKEFAGRRWTQLDEDQLSGSHTDCFLPLSSMDKPPISVAGLAESVAKEKEHHIHRQRPSVRVLGRKRLGQMIRRIFEDLSSDQYHEGRIAQEYGLTKATFSRFAGSRWTQAPNGTSGKAVPDLWLNTAQVLSTEAVFIEAAREAGVWQRVEATLMQGEAPAGRWP